MKKLLLVALAGAMLLGLSACGKKPVAPAATPAPAAFVVKPAPKLTPETLIRLRSEQAQRRAAFMAKRAAQAATGRPDATRAPPAQ